ncbi:MAG: aspartate aminotransferase family protein [Burkholderiales bacterium]
MSHLMKTYSPQAVAFERGEGVWLYDTNGKKYLDALAGIAVNGLGHAHPKLVKAISEQAAKIIHTSNLFTVPQQETLAVRLCELSGMEQAFFCSSGAEANEAAIKVARLYGHRRGVELPTIIVMEKAWHGRTIATLSATGSRKAQAGFEPLVAGFVRVPYNDIAAIENVAQNNQNIVAVLVEMIQGEGGVRVADAEFQRNLQTLCNAKEWLYMVDEVQTGIARTGEWFAYQHAGVQPDVLSLAKGLGSGVPIGACLGARRAKDVFQPGNHGTTFGGGPLACVAAITTLQAIVDEGLMENAAKVGAHLKSRLQTELKGVAGVIDIRGMGMMLGIELDRVCSVIVKRALEVGLVTNVTQDKVIRLLPALIMTQSEADMLIDKLVPLIKQFLSEPQVAATK